MLTPIEIVASLLLLMKQFSGIHRLHPLIGERASRFSNQLVVVLEEAGGSRQFTDC